MNNKKTVISLIISVILLIAMIGNVNAASSTFSFTVSPTQITAKPGDTILVNLGVADIDQESDGINAIQGKMTYDEELFENVDIVKIDGSDWKITLNKEEGNALKGTFIMDTMSNTKESGAVAVLKARIKSDATVTTGTIKFQDVFSSYGLTETAKSNKTITVNVEPEEDNEPEVPGDDNNNPANPDNPGATTQKPDTENKKPATQTPNKNTSKAPSLPKAGLSSWIVVGIVVAMIGAVIGYIRYKKIY